MFKQNDRVKFKIDVFNKSISGIGKIVGIATNDQPVIGRSYIIEPETKIKNYNYSHIVCFHCFLTKI